MAERFIERMTWPEVEAAIGRGVDAVLIPIGTTEQHGPHMPLDTDCFIARSLCARAAEAGEAEGVELLVAPTLNVTLSWYHMQFPGSMRLSTTTFFQVFREVCDSLAHHGFENLVAVNGHGGNVGRAHRRRQPLLRDDRPPRLPRAVVGPRRRRRSPTSRAR